jgi:hypothetical protein
MMPKERNGQGLESLAVPNAHHQALSGVLNRALTDEQRIA